MGRYTLKDGRVCVLEVPEVADAAELVAYVKQIAGETQNMTFGEGEFAMSVEDEEKFIRSLAFRDDTLFVVARVNGRIVANIHLQGTTRLRLKHRASFGISVLKEYWRLGIGKLLMLEMLDFARKHGITKINLRTRVDNTSAIALYQRFGFEMEGVERRAMRIDGEYVDFLLMGLLLD